MGEWLSKLLGQQSNILLVGFKGVGKTTTMFKMKLGEVTLVGPPGFGIKQVTLKKSSCHVP